MRFLVDESTGVVVARWLREQGYEVFSVYEEARGMDDDDIIHKAQRRKTYLSVFAALREIIIKVVFLKIISD